MNFDELYKFIGYSFVCLLLVYIAAKSIRFQLGVIEGLVGHKKKEIVVEKDDDKKEEKQNDDDNEEHDEDN